MEYEKLDPDFKQKWVEALRSGEYEQGEDYLAMYWDEKGDYKYCCLGVAAKVCGLTNDQIGDDQIFDYEFSHLNLIPKTLQGSTVGSDKNKIVEILTSMNDGTFSFRNNKQSFEQIADWIEINL